MPAFFDPPSFDASRILYEDEDLIVVDKPEGVPSQSADPTQPDDLVYRLSRFLAERAGKTGRAYLGVHQRLDQDTSGVILYAKRKEANAGLARQLEGRTVEKRYVACVEGWRGGDRRLEHRLVRGDDGRTHVASPHDRRAQQALSHVRVLERSGARTLLEVRIETGRTHQIRAQLAAEGAPVIGDRLYGGAPASRLFLHARSIALAHPTRGTPLVVEAPPPAGFAPEIAQAVGTRWATMDEPFELVLARAVERRWGLAHRAARADDRTSAYRVLDGDGEGAPGLAVDAYDRWLVAHLYADEVEQRLEPVLDALTKLGARGVYVKHRPRQANVIVDGRAEDFAPSLPTRGEPAPEPLVIHENGVPYLVRLGEGLSTGIFLDQRENRRRVRELAKGARVLNLFAYTCAFTVSAAAGGARETLSIDASARLLEWGRENLAHAGLLGDAHRFEVGDVFDALARLARERQRFELVCLDPPTYSTTRSSRWASGKDWARLAALTLAVLAPGGRLLACSNDRRMRLGAFRKHLHEGARAAHVSIAQMKDLPCPADFPAPFDREPHLKSVLVTTAPSRASAAPRRGRPRADR